MSQWWRLRTGAHVRVSLPVCTNRWNWAFLNLLEVCYANLR